MPVIPATQVVEIRRIKIQAGWNKNTTPYPKK
jgi:hypothetical protein